MKISNFVKRSGIAAILLAWCTTAFVPTSFIVERTTLKNGMIKKNLDKEHKQTKSLNMLSDPFILDQCMNTAASLSSSSSNMILAYSDDPVGDLLGGINGLVVAGILGAVVAVGIGFVS